MLAIDRWRKWRPSDEKFEESPECEPSKPSEPTFEGFEGSTSGQMQNFSDVPLDCAPDAWRQDFARWRAERCVSRQGYEDSAGIGALLRDFMEWCLAHDAVPCQRAVFETLLEEAGFHCAEGMAAGLLLRVDLEAVLCSQAAPQTSRTPEPATAETRRIAGRRLM
jgi:hypothetical protein